MNFTRFFGAPSAAPLEAATEATAVAPAPDETEQVKESKPKRRRKQAKQAAAATEGAAEAAPLPPRFEALLRSWDDLRTVVKSLEKMRHVWSC